MFSFFPFFAHSFSSSYLRTSAAAVMHVRHTIDGMRQALNVIYIFNETLFLCINKTEQNGELQIVCIILKLYLVLCF